MRIGSGARTLLNAAPARALHLDELRLLDFLVVNQSEAVTLAAPLGWPAEADAFARAAVAAHHALAVIVTLGAEGAIARSGHGAWRVAAPPVEVVDTTGAGDAFAGSLAAALDRGDQPRRIPACGHGRGLPRLHRGRRAERSARPCSDRLAGAMGQRIRGDALTLPPGPRCRTHSNRHTAAAAAALSDSNLPGIGMVTR